jgi:hypothetical protein
VDARLSPEDPTTSIARITVSRTMAWLDAAVATMLDIDPSRLRSGISAIRPASRLVLIGLLASIGCILVLTLLTIVYVTTSSQIPAAHAHQPTAPVSVASGESYDAIVSRPLFWRSRQPATVHATSARSLEVAGDPQISMKGVLISGDLAKAFIRSSESPAGEWRQLGEEVGGWRVAEILHDRIVLESSAGRFVVPMSYANKR